jgi:hypothetical protein
MERAEALRRPRLADHDALTPQIPAEHDGSPQCEGDAACTAIINDQAASCETSPREAVEEPGVTLRWLAYVR